MAAIKQPFRYLIVLVAAVLLLTIASQLAVPMVPVAVTLQTLAVTVIGGWLGWRTGTLAVLAWLLLAALGLPLLAEGTGGIAKFTGPSAGYLAAFPFAAALTGWLTARGWMRRRRTGFAALLIVHALCLGLGAAWLALTIGPARAIGAGVSPFLLGALLKSALGAAILYHVGQQFDRRGMAEEADRAGA